VRANALSHLGDASYSLYLTHAIALSALAWSWDVLGMDLGRPIFVLAGLGSAFALAFAIYHLFELPVSAALKKHFGKKSPLYAAPDGHPAPVSTVQAVKQPPS